MGLNYYCSITERNILLHFTPCVVNNNIFAEIHDLNC